MTSLPSTTTTYPLAYHITFRCYGTRLHGDPSLTVNRINNQYGTPKIPHHEGLQNSDRSQMKQPPYILDKQRREAVLAAIIEVCEYRKWRLIAVHVRADHVHGVVQADINPERIMIDFKAYSSRKLNRMGFENKNRRRWSRHGSTVYIWDEQGVADVMNYVVNGQGKEMEVYMCE